MVERKPHCQDLISLRLVRSPECISVTPSGHGVYEDGQEQLYSSMDHVSELAESIHIASRLVIWYCIYQSTEINRGNDGLSFIPVSTIEQMNDNVQTIGTMTDEMVRF